MPPELTAYTHFMRLCLFLSRTLSHLFLPFSPWLVCRLRRAGDENAVPRGPAWSGRPGARRPPPVSLLAAVGQCAAVRTIPLAEIAAGVRLAVRTPSAPK